MLCSAAEFVHKPLRITIGSAELTANNDVTQIVDVVEVRCPRAIGAASLAP